MGKLKKRIRSGEAAGAVEQYQFTTCMGAAEKLCCEPECHSLGHDNYAMALVRQQHESIFTVDYSR